MMITPGRLAIVAVLAFVAAAPRATTLSLEQTGTATISGIVTSTRTPAQPIRRATVTLSGDNLRPSRLTVSGDDGTFTLAKLPAGHFTLAVAKAAYVTTFYGTAPSGGASITLADGQRLAGISIALPKGAVISGVLKDQNGDAAAGVRVAVFHPSAGAGGLASPVGAAVTDDRGEYRVFGLAADTYIVAAMIRSNVPSQSSSPSSGNRGARGPQRGPLPPDIPLFYPGTASAADAKKIAVAAGEEHGAVNFTVQIPRAPSS